MSLRTWVAAAVLLGAALLAWQKREELQGWVGAASGGRQAGELRKCVNGSQVTYTDGACPAGYRAAAVQGGAVTVLPATPATRPSEAASGPSALHKALDITRDDRLQEKIMERQIEGAR